ncbi:nuclease [Chitinophaga sp. SYP-B3965]|uniref:thermonuclease family protein n=1 Tax=Chitinophaga sp. SYP-B3965 TaxID=2663120 RepID=UPI00129985A2|nr:thermonuclease family protein [Chitinophaga sp. SYP-B3965]MRG47348.1 nuclease [Chitinophaga sp. SYP-B3965]
MRVFLITLILFISATTTAQTYTGKVTAVKDGDTIEMLVNGKPIRIRFFGVDAPEKGQPFGEKAKQFTSGLCFGKVVKAVQKSKDQYRRVVAEVFLPDNTSLNYRLLLAGFAWHYKNFSKSEVWAAAELKAKKEKAGLWNDKHPIAPWDWRKKKR